MKKDHGSLYGIGIAIGFVFIVMMVTMVSQFLTTSNEGVSHTHAQDQEGGMVYEVFSLYQQDPISVDGRVDLINDNSYYYDPEKGEVEQIAVQDGQMVKKGDLLFKYLQKGDLQEEIEDTLREQTRLYNQRVSLIDQLSKQTGLLYNYQGDTLAGYWAQDGNYYYYVSEVIGKSGLPLVSDNPVDEATYQENVQGQTEGADSSEGIKDEIRQVNQQIEEIEIKLLRLYNKQHGEVRADYDGKVILNPEGKDRANVPLVRIISQGVQVKGSVSEYEFYLLAKDLPVQVYVNAEDRYVEGTIVRYDEIPPASPVSDKSDSPEPIDPGPGGMNTGTQFGFVVSPDDFIQPGFTVKIQMAPSGIVVPQEAILDEGDQQFVFRYVDGKAVKTPVKIQQQGLQKVVKHGLSVEDQLLLYPFDLKDGQVVEVMDPAGMDAMGDDMMEKGLE